MLCSYSMIVCDKEVVVVWCTGTNTTNNVRISPPVNKPSHSHLAPRTSHKITMALVVHERSPP